MTILVDWDEEQAVGDRSVVSQGSSWEGREKGKKGKKGKRENEGGTFQVAGGSSSSAPRRRRTPIGAALEERDDGDDGHDGDDDGGEGDNKGEGGDKGAEIGG